MTQPLSSPPLAPPPDPGSDIRSRWMLDRDIAFLNHGSFGSRLREVCEAQRVWRDRFETRPVEFLDRRRDELLGEAKSTVGGFLGMAPPDFGFTTNATEGVNAVLRSLRFEPGDEIATTNHVYNAVGQTMRYLTKRAGTSMQVVDVPVPCVGSDAITSAIMEGLGPRTRLLVVDHVTSPTAIRFPVEAIVHACAARGIDVLVDGAHAPGMLDLDVAAIGAAYYTGNLHKWIGAPPGAAFLWVRPDRQEGIHPTVISHFLDEGFAEEFAWQGTRDVSAWLTAADAIRITDGLLGPDSWPRIRRHNHELATWAQVHLARAWEVEPITPADGMLLGSMAALFVPEDVRARFADAPTLQGQLYDDARIEVPIFEWGGRWMIRPSAQIYNRPEEYERLAEAVGRCGR